MVPTQPACYAQRVVPEDQEDTQALGSWAATPYLACLASNAAGSELLLSPVCVWGGGVALPAHLTMPPQVPGGTTHPPSTVPGCPCVSGAKDAPVLRGYILEGQGEAKTGGWATLGGEGHLEATAQLVSVLVACKGGVGQDGMHTELVSDHAQQQGELGHRATVRAWTCRAGGPQRGWSAPPRTAKNQALDFLGWVIKDRGHWSLRRPRGVGRS